MLPAGRTSLRVKNKLKNNKASPLISVLNIEDLQS